MKHHIGSAVGALDRYRQARELIEHLEPLEGQLLERIVGGDSLARFAGELGLSLEDAAATRASLMKKLGAQSTADLVRIGVYAQSDVGR